MQSSFLIYISSFALSGPFYDFLLIVRTKGKCPKYFRGVLNRMTNVIFVAYLFILKIPLQEFWTYIFLISDVVNQNAAASSQEP